MAFARTARVLGGGGHFHYPHHVWTPSGGWWPSPANWKANTALAFGAIGGCLSMISMFSMANERRPMAPKNPILSQSWCAHAKIDDPSFK